MIKPIALALAIAVAPFSSFAAQFVEGKHFTQISNAAPSEEPKLTEFFSFYCHNCFNMETNYLPDIKASLKKGVKFDNKHVDFMNSDIGTEVMRALAVIQQVDSHQDALTHAMFAAIQGNEGANGHDHSAPGHEHKPEINSRDDIKKVFATLGIDANQYDELADNQTTNDKLALWRAQQNQFQVQSVPAFIVNDKYAVNLSEIRTLDELTGLINYLALEKDVKVAPQPSNDEPAHLGWVFASVVVLSSLAVFFVMRRQKRTA